MAKTDVGQCALCRRQSLLTAHHLIPRKLHRRKHFRKNFAKVDLQQTVLICRDCHNGLHSLYDEMQLGKNLNTIAKLLQDPQVKKHVDWVARKRTHWQ